MSVRIHSLPSSPLHSILVTCFNRRLVPLAVRRAGQWEVAAGDWTARESRLVTRPPPPGLPAGLSMALATLLLKALPALGWLPPPAPLLAPLTNSFLSCSFRPRREKRFPFYWLRIPSCPHRAKSPFGKLTCHLLSAWTLPSALGLKSPQSTENSSLTPKSLVACRESHRPLPQSWQLPSLLHSHCFAFSRMSHK